jgi:hypothetical protein
MEYFGVKLLFVLDDKVETEAENDFKSIKASLLFTTSICFLQKIK